jgi:hypothetical protein
LLTDVSGQYIGPVFNGQAVPRILLDCLTLKDETDLLSRNVGKQLPTYAPQHPRKPNNLSVVVFIFVMI